MGRFQYKGRNLSGMSQVKQPALVKKEGRKLFKSTSLSLLLFLAFQAKGQKESQATPSRNEVRKATQAGFPFSFTLNPHTHAPTPHTGQTHHMLLLLLLQGSFQPEDVQQLTTGAAEPKSFNAVPSCALQTPHQWNKSSQQHGEDRLAIWSPCIRVRAHYDYTGLEWLKAKAAGTECCPYCTPTSLCHFWSLLEPYREKARAVKEAAKNIAVVSKSWGSSWRVLRNHSWNFFQQSLILNKQKWAHTHTQTQKGLK